MALKSVYKGQEVYLKQNKQKRFHRLVVVEVSDDTVRLKDDSTGKTYKTDIEHANKVLYSKKDALQEAKRIKNEKAENQVRKRRPTARKKREYRFENTPRRSEQGPRFGRGADSRTYEKNRTNAYLDNLYGESAFERARKDADENKE